MEATLSKNATGLIVLFQLLLLFVLFVLVVLVALYALCALFLARNNQREVTKYFASSYQALFFREETS